MQRGFFIPTVFVIVALLVLVPVLFWLLINRADISKSDNVRGASVVNEKYTKSGFAVSVISKSGTWDLYEYLCKTKDECEVSLNSGKNWGIVSGGETTGHEVMIEASDEWKDYKYLKLFAKPSWLGSDTGYRVIETGDITASEIVKFTDSSKEIETLFIPVSGLFDKYQKSAVFSD
ncbi:hypothetical protein A3H26_01760 [candidate division WWE3 bacterium RIFCSPLOWO2_12_FULL_36_10]|uniref:Uncharacterized protein n=1 Tax=candidate division WWE3 bacterium RIFCSPLOWO2_12_FULL_36_10 TaxID=1802630 RepID=A0A1F4VHD8_UNCKA|nr:MAG: hypothetical protein A3H26_01760 [candidate division WWE3 bacterium RIFCSPLOWO2_12_FULL_36_10]